MAAEFLPLAQGMHTLVLSQKWKWTEGVFYAQCMVQTVVNLNSQINNISVSIIMGQINCQCKEVLLQHQLSNNNRNQFVITFSPELEDVQQPFTNIEIGNKNGVSNIRVVNTETITFGTGSDCLQKYHSVCENQFKMEVKLSSRSVLVKDCSVGLGCFLMKKKVFVKKMEQTFISVDDLFITVNLTNSKIYWKIFEIDQEKSCCSELQRQVNLEIKGVKMFLKREKGGEEYSLRREDRKGMFLLLTQEQRVRTNDILRLGCEYFQVGSITTASEPICRESQGRITSFKW